MSVKLSSLMGMDIYTDNATYVGKVFDIILDLQKGEVVRLTMEPIKVTSKEEAKRVFKEKTVLYKNVKAAENIIIVNTGPNAVSEEEMDETPKMAEKPQPYSYRYRRTPA